MRPPKPPVFFICGCLRVGHKLYLCHAHTIHQAMLELRRLPLEAVDNVGGRECVWTYEAMMANTREEWPKP